MQPLISRGKEMAGDKLHVLLVPFPAQGHVTPMLQLAQALHSCGFRPIVFIPDFIHILLSNQFNEDMLSNEAFEFYVIPTGIEKAEAENFAAVDDVMESTVPGHLEKLLQKRRKEMVCMVGDMLASWAFPVADRCGIPVSGFWPAMFATYRIVSAIPELISCGLITDSGTPVKQLRFHMRKPYYKEEGEKLSSFTSGLATPSAEELPWLVGNPASQCSRFKFWLRVLDRTKSLQWLLVNSFPSEATSTLQHGRLKVFEIGPLFSITRNTINNRLNPSRYNTNDDSCEKWLAKQKPNSVIYISFGTWVSPLSPDVITNIALGIEATQEPFLWVLKDDNAWRAGLPNGFVDRVADRGKVISWVQQDKVLSHESVGCYITHCGWNSTLEAIKHGKRLVCFPISGDQFVISAYIVNVWGIGIRLNESGRKDVFDCVKRVTSSEEGQEIQRRVLELRDNVMGREGQPRARNNLECFSNLIRNANVDK